MKRSLSFRLANYTKTPIAIVGLSRGGTTHFAELLNDGKMNTCWEPLTNLDYLRLHHGLHDYVIGDPPYIPEDNYSPVASAYFNDVFGGRVFHPAYVLATPQTARARSLIIKFCRGGNLLPYFAAWHPCALIHLVRSPFAVVASQLRFPSYQKCKAIEMTSSYIVGSNKHFFLGRYGSLIDGVTSREEMLAIWWCLNHVYPLSLAESRQWLTVFHEDLYGNPAKTFGSISCYCEEQGASCATRDDMQNRLHEPSRTVQKGSQFERSGSFDQWAWKADLSANQVSIIADVLKRFGLEGYLESRWLP